MFFVKNKRKNETPVIEFLEERLEEARRRDEHSFYYPLRDDEITDVREYFCTHHNTIVEVSHQNGEILVYKFYGYDM